MVDHLVVRLLSVSLVRVDFLPIVVKMMLVLITFFRFALLIFVQVNAISLYVLLKLLELLTVKLNAHFVSSSDQVWMDLHL